MKPTYAEKLRDPRWQKKRLEAMEAAEFKCQLCSDDSSTLHVHHKAYFKGREPWEYEIGQLSVLCESCHQAEHESEDPFALVGSYLTLDGPHSRRDAAALLIGFGTSLDLSNRLLEQFVWSDESWAIRLASIGLLANTIAGCAYRVDDGFYNELAWAVHEAPDAFVKLAQGLIDEVQSKAKPNA